MPPEGGSAMRRKTHKEFISEIQDRPFIALEEYGSVRTKMRFKCTIDGHVWKALPRTILRGSGCPVCGARIQGEKLRGENVVLEDHGDWVLVDISTEKHPQASMAIDADTFHAHRAKGGGRIGAHVEGSSHYIYAGYREGSKRLSAHHDALPLEGGFDTDHIKHGTMSFVDNRRSNLRRVSRSQNAMNHSVNTSNTSGTTGVCWDKQGKRWVAYIKVSGARLHLGRFATIASAITARRIAEQTYFGEHAFNGGI